MTRPPSTDAHGTPPREVYRVDWLPGTDVLHGTCHCGAEHADQDPVSMWEWMLAHPRGHAVSSPQEDSR
ncbi:hypothetical protein OK074_2242 [Actinobacteria bacterium OK074]|nr:hypothetical protein OK074_2242 [Actinobacteria bacterium OK074]